MFANVIFMLHCSVEVYVFELRTTL